MAALGVANTVLSDSNCSSGVLRDDVHTILTGLGRHGALGAVPPHTPLTTREAGNTLATLLDRPHSPHHGRTRRCRH
eukprot:7383628-Prymnesium_polylepis.1